MKGFISLIIFLLVSVSIFIYYRHSEYFSTGKYDIVYTWVDENDPERQEYMKKYLKDYNEDGNNRDSRYNQNNELLYSIRSAEKNCPWLRNIYVVVKDGQVPMFLNFKNPRIKLINHSQIMPKDSLPTFNSLAIETCIHKIPGLSDMYVYMNDDIFVMKPFELNEVSVSWKPGKDKIIKPTDLEHFYIFDLCFGYNLQLANKLLGTNVNLTMPHVPSICYKPWEIEIENMYRKIPYKDTNMWDDTTFSKFRKNSNVALNNCVRTIYYLSKGVPINNKKDQIVLLDKNCEMKIQDVDFVCVNHIDKKCREKFNEQMNEIFPQKSQFEN